MRIAIIGGAGFVGHHLALAFRQSGHDVLVVDSLAVNNCVSLWESQVPHWAYRWIGMTTERLRLLKEAGVEFRAEDARDYHRMSGVLSQFRPDTIVHLAAVAHIDRSNKDPHSTFDHSLRTLENSLDVARALGGPHFIFFSSSTAYGPFPTPVVDETCRLDPTGIYGSLKAGAELMVRAYHQAFGLPFTIVRPQALYGPRCVSMRVIQKFIESAFDDGELRIEGDGTAVHDFTYIDDLVDGVLRIVQNPKARNETFNITAADARSLKDLANLVVANVGQGRIVHTNPDPDKPSRGTMTVEKASRLLGYTPAWTLERGIEAYVKWYREFLSC